MSDEKMKKENAYAQLTGFKRALPIILAALAVFVGLCFIMQDTGALGNFISDVLLGLFSIGGYFIPAFIAIHAVFYPSDSLKKRALTRFIFTLLTVITISTLTHTVTNFNETIGFDAKQLYNDGISADGGGFIGGLFAFLLTKIFGTVGVIIIAVLLFALYITYFFSGTRSALSRLLLKILNFISDFFSSFGKKKEKDVTKKSKRLLKKEIREIQERKNEQLLLEDDEFFAADNGMQELTISKLEIHERRSKHEVERNPHLQDKVFTKSRANTESKESFTYEKNDFYSDSGEQKKHINTDYSTFDSRRDFYGSVGETVYEPRESDIIYDTYSTAKDSSPKRADDVFGDGFEPFDLKISEELSNKPSSYGKKQKPEPDGISEFAEPIRNVSEEDIEKARQRADFELKKRAAIEAQKRYEDARRAEAERVRSAYHESPSDTYVQNDESEPYIPDYMSSKPVENNTSESVFVNEEDTEQKRREESFASAIYDYEKERDQVFKPYNPPSVDELTQNEEEKEDEELKITRTILDPTPASFEDEDFDGESEEENLVFDEEDEDELDESYPDFDKIEELVNEDNLNDAPLSEPNPDVLEQRKMFPFLDEEDEEEDGEIGSEKDIIDIPTPKQDSAPPFDIPFAPKSTFDEKRPIFEEKKPQVEEKKQSEPESAPEKPDYSDYQFPPVELLAKAKVEVDANQEEEKNRNAEILVDTLSQFNVKVAIKGVDCGPRITRYEIVPAKGVKVAKVMALYNDIALNLGVEGVRMEAPIPGKSAIGVEIPNRKPETVALRDLVESDEFICAPSKTYSCLGKDVTGNPVFADIAKMPHVLIAGATGMGKSVCINSILISILYKARPDEVKLIMIDPKKVEFNGYNGIPHLLIPVVTDVKQAAGALMWAVEQMEKRYDLMEALEVRKLDSYNEKVRENPALGEPLPKIVIVIDELNDIMLQVRKPAEDLIMSIAQKARAAGIHLIIGTQRPSVDVITGVIKANIPSRISCKVASFNDSKTILEQAGAEKLLNNGDMLYISAGAPKALRVQGAFVSDPEVVSVMKFLKAQAKGVIYDSQALEEINRAAQKCSKGKGDEDDYDERDAEENIGILNDQQFLDAVELAIRSSKISTSLIQRKIGIGYGKAAKFIDNMEDLGIVSEPNGQKPRDVLITMDDWHEMLARRSLD